DNRVRKRWFQSDALRLLSGRLELLKEQFGSSTQDLARVALSYCLARYEHACVVVGFTTPDQVTMNTACIDTPLSLDELSFARQAMSGVSDELGSYFA
ncbi:MAG TPA: hypothetical protein VFU48_16440, partial [Nitrospira sp.]|nr:hypothetical protein [Nitrospira sp.]